MRTSADSHDEQNLGDPDLVIEKEKIAMLPSTGFRNSSSTLFSRERLGVCTHGHCRAGMETTYRDDQALFLCRIFLLLPHQHEKRRRGAYLTLHKRHQ